MRTRAPLETAVTWLDAGHRIAVATVISTWGSAPRRPGAVMVINETGDFVGSVSGGCVEGAVVEEAREILATGGARLLEYGVSSEQAWEVGLACGGTVSIHLQSVDDDTWIRTIAGADDRSDPLVTALQLETGTRTVIRPMRVDEVHPLREEARAAVDADTSRLSAATSEDVFLHVFNPPVRVVVLGAVHIAQQLAAMAGAAGMEVVVVDPRTTFATPPRFPGTRLVTEWPQAAFREIGLDRRTAVVALTHDPKLDDPGLSTALSSDAFYVGALGSRKTHAHRLERLRESGVTPDLLERIHAPIGLDIGARTPGEIAAAIVAEIIQSLRTSVA